MENTPEIPNEELQGRCGLKHHLQPSSPFIPSSVTTSGFPRNSFCSRNNAGFSQGTLLPPGSALGPGSLGSVGFPSAPGAAALPPGAVGRAAAGSVSVPATELG